ncbi:lycopene cyclase domain-containing protein [Candidatus Ferrigenium straubiae]|uniref:lycopene cyclase domain-containing protein n=1 Tax=Candidatus Ferrigenium straubiae TaxID=2919506 RepID=UPI003F4AA411
MKYVWLSWSGAFLVPWALLYFVRPGFRQKMLRVSLATSLLGLSEPIFVPEYWNPPSLFDLAQRTGFDIESLIFCFAIGGIGAVMYNALVNSGIGEVPHTERHNGRHRWHRLAIAAPFLAFPMLYFLPWNPIYPGIVAMALGGIANVLCRPDLLRNTLIGGGLFLLLYAIFMLLLIFFAPGYIEQVWNLPALSGVLLGGIPLEELAFGFAFGLYWAGIYEHFTWHRDQPGKEAGHA